MRGTTEELANGIVQSKDQYSDHVSYTYQHWGHAGYIHMAVERTPGVSIVRKSHRAGWSNTSVVIGLDNGTDELLNQFLQAYWSVVDEKKAERRANKGQLKAAKPTPTPRMPKPAKPLKNFLVCVDTGKKYQAYWEGTPHTSNVYPELGIKALSHQKAKEAYEAAMKVSSTGNQYFAGALFVTAKEVK